MTVTELMLDVHAVAKSKGWWDCERCDSTGSAEGVVCPDCTGSGFYRPLGTLFALVHSEVSEALEALRDPEADGVCSKCCGASSRTTDRHLPLEIAAGVFLPPRIPEPEPLLECSKCNGTGNAIGGSRFLEELADVQIRTLDIAGFFACDLEPELSSVTRYLQERHLVAERADPGRLCLLHDLVNGAFITSWDAYEGKAMGMARSLAMIWVYCNLIAERDLTEVVQEKTAYNRKRSRKHGRAF